MDWLSIGSVHFFLICILFLSLRFWLFSCSFSFASTFTTPKQLQYHVHGACLLPPPSWNTNIALFLFFVINFASMHFCLPVFFAVCFSHLLVCILPSVLNDCFTISFGLFYSGATFMFNIIACLVRNLILCSFYICFDCSFKFCLVSGLNMNFRKIYFVILKKFNTRIYNLISLARILLFHVWQSDSFMQHFLNHTIGNFHTKIWHRKMLGFCAPLSPTVFAFFLRRQGLCETLLIFVFFWE